MKLDADKVYNWLIKYGVRFSTITYSELKNNIIIIECIFNNGSTEIIEIDINTLMCTSRYETLNGFKDILKYGLIEMICAAQKGSPSKFIHITSKLRKVNKLT